MMNVLPVFTGQSETLDLGTSGNSLTSPTHSASLSATAGGSAIRGHSRQTSAERRLSVPPSPKPFSSPAPKLGSTDVPPRAAQEYTYADLWRDGDRKKSPPDCDISALETYLSDAEFASVLKMTRLQFYVLPPWRQRQLKVAVRLW